MFRASFVVALALAGASSAQERVRHIRIESTEQSQERAGNPQEISHFAQPANQRGYTGGWVGGGGLLNFGRGKSAQEGTWGWDYTGPSWHPGRIFSSWAKGKTPKGGTYKTDGPHVPDIFAIKKPEKEAKGKE